MSTETIIRTARPSWPDWYGSVEAGEVRVSIQRGPTVGISPAEARKLAAWLLDAARRAEEGR